MSGLKASGAKTRVGKAGRQAGSRRMTCSSPLQKKRMGGRENHNLMNVMWILLRGGEGSLISTSTLVYIHTYITYIYTTRKVGMLSGELGRVLLTS